jgi:hypothetical protein
MKKLRIYLQISNWYQKNSQNFELIFETAVSIDQMPQRLFCTKMLLHNGRAFNTVLMSFFFLVIFEWFITAALQRDSYQILDGLLER